MEATVLIGFATGIITFFIGYLTFLKNRDKDTRLDARRDAVMESKLDVISQGVETFRIDSKSNELRVSQMHENYIRIEESLKQAHKRIDKIEEKIVQ